MDPDEIAELAEKLRWSSRVDLRTRQRIYAALQEFERDKREWLTIPRM